MGNDFGALSKPLKALGEKFEDVESIGLLELLVCLPELRSHILPFLNKVFSKGCRTYSHVTILRKGVIQLEKSLREGQQSLWSSLAKVLDDFQHLEFLLDFRDPMLS